MTMPFGKHKGMDILDVPLAYLKWLEENGTSLRPEQRKQIQIEIERRTGDRPGARKVVKEGR